MYIWRAIFTTTMKSPCPTNAPGYNAMLTQTESDPRVAQPASQWSKGPRHEWMVHERSHLDKCIIGASVWGTMQPSAQHTHWAWVTSETGMQRGASWPWSCCCCCLCLREWMNDCGRTRFRVVFICFCPCEVCVVSKEGMIGDEYVCPFIWKGIRGRGINFGGLY